MRALVWLSERVDVIGARGSAAEATGGKRRRTWPVLAVSERPSFPSRGGGGDDRHQCQGDSKSRRASFERWLQVVHWGSHPHVSRLFQPVLQYSSAFDDEVAELAEDTAEAALECVPEESPEAVADPSPEPQLEEESPANQAESTRPSATVVHGPYYYFYQGVWINWFSRLPFPTPSVWRKWSSYVVFAQIINVSFLKKEEKKVKT